MLDRLDDLEREFVEVEARLGDPGVIGDPRRLEAEARRHKELAEVVGVGRDLRAALDDLEAARQMAKDASVDERELARTEVGDGERRVADLEERLRLLLLPKDPNDGKNVIIEVRGAEGGEEANLFARDLFRMYQGYATRHGWRTDVLQSNASDMDGFTDVTFLVVGDDAWSRLKHEGGPHRVQRVPVTESQGRVHTSSATVTVLPEAEEVDVKIDPNDLEVDVFRSSGPGGQSVNTTDSAVRLTHVPTGIVVSMQDEKSQRQNREKALRVLRSRLLKAEQDRRSADLSDRRRDQIGGGGRSEKVRTYNFKENRVTDHRIGFTLYQLDRVLDGDLDGVVDALLEDERAAQLQGGTEG